MVRFINILLIINLMEQENAKIVLSSLEKLSVETEGLRLEGILHKTIKSMNDIGITYGDMGFYIEPRYRPFLPAFPDFSQLSRQEKIRINELLKNAVSPHVSLIPTTEGDYKVFPIISQGEHKDLYLGFISYKMRSEQDFGLVFLKPLIVAIKHRYSKEINARQTEALKALYADLPHDLRGPLAYVIANIEGASMVHSIDKKNEFICKAQLKAKLALNIFDKIIVETLTHILADKQEPMSLDVVVRTATELSSILPEEITVTLPNQVNLTTYTGLPELVLEKLISNAYKHKAPHTKVEIGTRFDSENLYVEVRNHGRTLMAEETDNLFKIPKDIKVLRNGLGLGLWIAKSLGKYAGFEINRHSYVKDDQVIGEVFYVKIPLYHLEPHKH